MKTEWDYTGMAQAYLKRPDYSDIALERLFEISSLRDKSVVCDVGAGVAHLTLKLLRSGFEVIAVEPNEDMRQLGIQRTSEFDVKWCEGVGENTRQSPKTFDLVTFGSSFNVCDRQKALVESKRILRDEGWFAAMWNHRDLTDPIQAEIESIIKSVVEGYGYGSRREDQTEEIKRSGLFQNVRYIEGAVEHVMSKKDIIEAWKSHATLERQAKGDFMTVIDKVSSFINELPKENIVVPYTTRIWAAQLN
ncbi:class I SAM-dependent methyltransferase [Catenovulum sediminis]|uniref:class I SAM-dependent methyltransferase n=1 Tax=Catenovulum sediminis TaxID=1740262 RepID=UPI00117C18BF|nr:class I SAM-dependent methyltransferase [Catenovulum sediminis]